MSTYQHKGNSIPFVAAADLPVNSVVVLGDLVGVTKRAANSGDEAELHLEGVFQFPTSQPVADEGFEVGESVCWDVANNFPIAYDATQPALGHITELFENAINVRLCQSVGGVEPAP